jgi:acyl-coenzyme A thioesterase PaaI-like protein
MCVTGELTVRYLLRVPADRELIVTAAVQKASRLLARVTATVADEEGTVYARAEGRFVPMSAKETLLVDDNLLYREGDAHLFAGLRAAD